MKKLCLSLITVLSMSVLFSCSPKKEESKESSSEPISESISSSIEESQSIAESEEESLLPSEEESNSVAEPSIESIPEEESTEEESLIPSEESSIEEVSEPPVESETEIASEEESILPSEEESIIPSEEESYAESVEESVIESEIESVVTSSEEILTSYNLSLTINPGVLGNTFHDIQFIYNYTNSTQSSSYDWNHKISESKLSSYSYVVEDLDISKPLYFKIYMWDSSLGDIYVGVVNELNFVYNPRGRKIECITIEFDYPSVSGNIVGAYSLDQPNDPSTVMSFDDQTVSVYKKSATIDPVFDHDKETFTAHYEGENIRIDGNTIIGLKSNTTTEVRLVSQGGLECTFNVNVSSSKYRATSARDSKWASSEKWFVSNTVEEIPTIGQDFMHGMDISSMKALYDNGSKFYNKDGNEQSLIYILKDYGFNWVRVKLFNDPNTLSGTSYGAGEGTLENALWIAHEVKSAGLNLLLDIHYSDYWTHPGQQILPKAWSNVETSDELATLIREYTTETLNAFKDNNCLPDMVQLGNEISSGNFLQKPGADSETFTSYENTYVTAKSNLSDDIKGTSGSANMIKYLSAASDGVNAVDSNIKKIIHWAKGSTFSAIVINKFFNALSSVDYDYAGLSLYPYYCFPTGVTAESGGIDTLNDTLASLNISKPWFVAETSYPFSGNSWVYENNKEVTNFIINNWSTNSDVANIETMMENYPFTPSGQAKMIHDVTYSVSKNGGLGIFYWEGAWIPNIKVGWAGSGSPCSWSNQGFFSYDGKMISNLELFKQMDPNI
ncbi:MAG: glycosyl hydrolase 53 family protein [Bacilli bacterium]|nr:glycosyl hydrolase 53 family protein [Bacilli bacterium]